jgi:predicted transcriptional regulator
MAKPNHANGAPAELPDRRDIAAEAKLIAVARASAANGRTVASDQVDAWIDSLGTNHELPPPKSGR